jgi:hypothetical protein
VGERPDCLKIHGERGRLAGGMLGSAPKAVKEV